MGVARAKGLALVTGASSGIGLELAKLFAADRGDRLIAARSDHVDVIACRVLEAATISFALIAIALRAGRHCESGRRTS